MELKRTDLNVARERAVLVGASQDNGEEARDSLHELRRLADTARSFLLERQSSKVKLRRKFCKKVQNKTFERSSVVECLVVLILSCC